MQNIPLVYGDSMLGSEKWDRRRPALREGLQVEPEKAHGAGSWQPLTDVVEDVIMDEAV
jgi:hypothetical protein